MADQRISQLTALLQADVDAVLDQLPIADISTAETKKVTPAALVLTGVKALPAGTIPGSAIIGDSITAVQIAANAIGAAELADGAVDTAALQAKAVTAAQIADDTITAAQIAANAVTASELADGAVDTLALADGAVTQLKLAADSVGAVQIQANAVTASELANGAVGTAAIVDLAVTSAKIASDAVTAAQIATGAVGAAELAAGAVGAAALVNGAVAYAKIQNVTATDKLLGRSSAGAGVVEEISCTAAGRALLDDVSAADQRTTLGLGTLATQSGTFSGTHSGASSGTNTGDQTITLTGAVTGTGTGSFATSISAGAVNTAALADGAVTAAKIASDSITAAQIAPDAVGASELANNAVDTGAIADGAVTSPKIGAGAVDTTQLAASGVTAAKVAAGAIGTTQLADAGVTAIKMAGDLSGAAFAEQNVNIVLAGPATGGVGKPTFRALISADLPAATATAKGAVSLLPGGGLSIGTGGELSITNAVVAATNPVVTYNSKGLVTGGRALVSADLPKAAVGAAGGVVPGDELTVTTPGTLDHATSGVAPGVYSKVTVNKFGHVTTGATLQSADVPTLDASKIGAGTLDPARIGNKSIANAMLADYSIAYIQEAPPSVTGQHAGMLWLQESTGQLRMFNSNSWFPVGFGRLSAENLRYCGTFNAATGTISGVTQFGTTEGFKINDPIPAASDPKSGVYFVCTTPGNGTPVATGVTFDNGDWILCNGVTAGWARIDTLNGGGGGGGAQHLNDMLDVTLTAPSLGDQLVFGGSGQWVNKAPVTSSPTTAGLVQLATQAEVDAGTNALKAVTSKTLQDAVLDCGSF